METQNKNIVTLINDLIIINNDRIEGYERAAKETEEAELKSMFSRMADESRMYKNELVREVVNNGGTPAEGTTTSGKVFRAWMDVKAALTGRDRKAIIASCEFGEDAALETYEEVLKSDDLTPNLRTMVTKQKASLQMAHDKIKMMRDSEKKM
jgi:uncharacterized protein (TIGR02284 family)